jgi:hypothetical protein
MTRYRLRTLLIVLALGPPVIGVAAYVTSRCTQVIENFSRRLAPQRPSPGTDALHDEATGP